MSDHAVSEPAQRRTPVQQRGERRVDAILDAAAAVIAEVGYEELTLRAVVKRSGSAIGSIYHFFPDKDALVDALLERIVRGVRELFPTVLSPDLERGSVASFVHAMVDPIARFAIQHPEVPALTGPLFARAGSVDAEITARLDAIFHARVPSMPPAERGRVVRMTLGIVRAGIQLIAAAGPAGRAATQAELEAALAAYLRVRLRRAPG
jgi:AcrR family transcriptional regulator